MYAGDSLESISDSEEDEDDMPDNKDPSHLSVDKDGKGDVVADEVADGDRDGPRLDMRR